MNGGELHRGARSRIFLMSHPEMTLRDVNHVTSDDNHITSADFPRVQIGFSRGHGVREERSILLGGFNTGARGFLPKGRPPKLV